MRKSLKLKALFLLSLTLKAPSFASEFEILDATTSASSATEQQFTQKDFDEMFKIGNSYDIIHSFKTDPEKQNLYSAFADEIFKKYDSILTSEEQRYILDDLISHQKRALSF
jgi:hypothetical protein